MSNQNSHLLAGKRAVVTGAGRGIGRSIALALAQAGADVAVTARTHSEIEQLVNEIQTIGCRSLAVSCDVTDSEQVTYMATTFMEGLGGVDILVNNAGNAGSHKFSNHPDELWHRMLSINLTSVYYVTKAFVPSLIEQRYGRIINIASIASRVGGSYIAAYTAAKHGVLGLTRALAVELMPYEYHSQCNLSWVCEYSYDRWECQQYRSSHWNARVKGTRGFRKYKSTKTLD